MDKYLIRKADIKDLEAIFQVEQKAYPIPWSRENLKQCLIKDYLNFVMIIKGEVVGHMILQAVCDEIQLLNLCVRPENQRTGLGNRWMNYLVETGRKLEAKSIFLEVRASNLSAQNLYQKYDFTQIGIRKSYYSASNNGREDAVVMSLNLD